MTAPVTAGVDGSNESRAALAWAAREAERRRLPLHVVHAWRFEVHDAVDLGDRDDQGRRVHDMVDGMVREVAERHPGLEVTCEIAEGRAVDVLTAAAAEAQLLVLGSRGHGVLVGFQIGRAHV